MEAMKVREVAIEPALGTDPRRRTFRVLVLLTAIVLMSAADLHMTLFHLQSVGMSEGNPIARWLIAFDSPTVLGMWKLATAGLACVILFYARRTRIGEIATWICLGVLAWLMIQWVQYSVAIQDLGPAMDLLASADDPRWMRMSN